MMVPAVAVPVVFGVVAATMLAALAHLLRGQNTRDLLGMWLRVQAGFWLAHVIAALLNLPLYTVGDLQIVAAVAGGALAAVLGIIAAR